MPLNDTLTTNPASPVRLYDPNDPQPACVKQAHWSLPALLTDLLQFQVRYDPDFFPTNVGSAGDLRIGVYKDGAFSSLGYAPEFLDNNAAVVWFMSSTGLGVGDCFRMALGYPNAVDLFAQKIIAGNFGTFLQNISGMSSTASNGSSSISHDTTAGNNGVGSLRWNSVADSPGTSDCALVAQNVSQLQPGKTYRLSARIRKDLPTVNTGSLGFGALSVMGLNDAVLVSETTTPSNAASAFWVAIDVVFTTGADVDITPRIVTTLAAGDSFEVLVDDLSLREYYPDGYTYAVSDPFTVRRSACAPSETLLVEYSEDTAQLSHDPATFANRIRVDARLHNFQMVSDENVYINSLGQSEIVSALLRQRYELQVSHNPLHVLRGLIVALKHRSLSVESASETLTMVCEDAPRIDSPANGFPLSTMSASVVNSTDVYRNTYI